jgi:hypothetical protein
MRKSGTAICTLFLSFFGGCPPKPRPVETAGPPAIQAESCLFSSPVQIPAAIDDVMQKIAAKRIQAISCAGQNPPNQRTGDVSSVKSNYGAWLSYVSAALRNGSAATIDQQVGRNPEGTAFGGLGRGYKDIADAAEGIDQFVKDCQNASSRAGAEVRQSADHCGKDVDCQHAEAFAFQSAGESIFFGFKGCDADVRRQASDYLSSHYSW